MDISISRSRLLVKISLAAFSTLVGLVSLASGIISVITNDHLSAHQIISFIVFLVFSVIAISLYSLFRVQKYNETTSLVNKYFDVFSDSIHIVCSKMIRMQALLDSRSYQSISEFSQDVTSDVCQLMDFFSKVLSDISNAKVRACIKSVDASPSEGQFIRTFARSGIDVDHISVMMQEQKHPIRIIENSDFSEICSEENDSPQKQFFMKENLYKYARELKKLGHKYRNSNKEWRDTYKTTIVCPIRAKKESKDIDGVSVTKYDLLGFFCVDSLDETAFAGNRTDICTNYVLGVSDVLYQFLACYLLCKTDLSAKMSIGGKSNGNRISDE